jgi:acetate kinase
MNIVVFNAGSSSLKLSCYQLARENISLEPSLPLWLGQIDWNSHGMKIMRVKTAAQKERCISSDVAPTEASRQDAIQELLSWLWTGEMQVLAGIWEIDMVGHRVVHGGEQYRQPTLINAEVQAEIDRLSVFAPLHNPANLMGMAVMASLAPDLPQMAVFDTAFYGDLPETAYVYPLPYQWLEQGIRKYGFHGISHQYCTQRAAQLLGRELPDLRLISCHLGNGCSLAALKFGQCIDTTMGFTPLDGLMMGTRCGSIDPGIILHLWREGEYTVSQLDHLLNFESGLLGVSGVSNDLREIDRAIAAGNARAQLAFDIYVDRLTAKIAALLPALGGLDALIFTAGVGENHAGLRAIVASKLAFLGVKIDLARNSLPISADQDVATAQSPVRLLIIHTQEEWEIARACWQYWKSMLV